MTTREAIRKECGVERFDVADTANILGRSVDVMVKRDFTREEAITLAAIIYRTAQRELTTK